MKQNSLYLYAMLLLIVCSCGKKDEPTTSKLDKVDARSSARLATTAADNVNDVMGFYTFMETPTNGMFGVTQHSIRSYSQQSDTSDDTYRFSGAFYDANKNIISGGKITFGGIEFSPVNNFYSFGSYYIPGRPGRDITKYGALEGQTFNFSIDPRPGGTTTTMTTARPVNPTLTGTIYAPKKVHMSTTGTKTQVGNNYFDVWNFQGILNPLTFTVNWNADAQNDKGVVISFEYDQQLSQQFYIKSPAFTTKRYKAFRTPDNGSYTIKMDDLKDMWPNRDIYQQFNAVVIVTVARANYAIVNNPSNLQKYSIYAGSAQETPIILNWLPWPHIGTARMETNQ